jgi:ribosome biogenesis protein YTM1
VLLGDSGSLLSGALDRSILAWEYNQSDSSYSVLYECRGHTGGVESIAVNAAGDRFASGSADATIKLWTTIVPNVSDHIEEVTETRKKRKTVKEDRILKVNTNRILLYCRSKFVRPFTLINSVVDIFFLPH